jgi:predicted dinucleotide-binding enzyme
MSIDNIFIVGAGLMGGGIAQVCAQAGLEVTITDISTEGMDRAIENIAWSRPAWPRWRILIKVSDWPPAGKWGLSRPATWSGWMFLTAP